ncbi:aspartyl protease family protein [Treponema denticola]
MKQNQCKLIKMLSASLIFFCFFSGIFAQNEAECEKAVQALAEACNEKSVTNLLPYLAEDFSIAGQSGNRAKAILQQLLAGVGTVISYEKTESLMEDGKLILKYSIEYSQVGKKESVFIFNKDNLIVEAELMKIKVKTLSSEERTIEYNTNKITSIPFIFAGNLPLVDVLLEGESRLFLLDSGAPFSILNSKYIEGLNTGTKKLGSFQDVSGNVSSPNMDITNVKELEFAGSKIKNQKIVVLDMTRLEQSLKTNGIYGLIGYDMLKEYDVFLDYQKKRLTLIRPDSYDSFIKANTLKVDSKIPCKMAGHIPAIEVSIGNKIYKLGLDTGAEFNLLDSFYFNELEPSLTNKEKTELSGAGGIKQEIYQAELKTMKIGGKTYKNVKTVFSDISHLRKKPDSYDGLLGYPFFSAQPTLISYKRGEIILFK